MAEGENVVCVLGRAFLAGGVPVESLQRTVLILTDRRLYQLGVYYDPDGDRGFTKKRGSNDFDLADLTAISLVERPVAKRIGIIGWILLVGGLAILGAGFIQGSGVAIAIGLFVGAVWMAVPGVLMIVHWKTGGETYLQIEFGARAIAAACRRYSDAELSEFRGRCSAWLVDPGAS